MNDLSIITPAAAQRFPRIHSIFNRLQLNAERNPAVQFEFIIVDDSLDQEYMDLAIKDWSFQVKYISLPLGEKYPNPSYMRNVGFRIAEGRTFTMIDADHWVHEDFVLGAIEAPNCLNTGFMIDTGKGKNFSAEINAILIKDSKLMKFSTCMDLLGINGPKRCNRVWLVSYPSKAFLDINGYDEKYTTGYSHEDDDIYYRLASLLPIHYDAFERFAGVHLRHPQPARNDDKNEKNRKYYRTALSSYGPIRNKAHEWGKMVEGSFSLINGKKREFEGHEQYISNLGREEYGSPWRSFKELQSMV